MPQKASLRDGDRASGGGKATILEYSDERLEEIKEVSGNEICDFLTPRARKKGWYEDENGEHQPLPEYIGF